jgi:hypothetical protein
MAAQGSLALVVLATALVLLASFVLHFEGLSWISRILSRLAGARRRRVLYGVLWTLALHLAEIGLFGLAIFWLMEQPGRNDIAGVASPGLADALYLSAISYSTVGFGDLAPLGPIRVLIAVESLAGLMLIAWSASFTYFEMERNWRER